MNRIVKPQGEIRQSQLVTTFGPGSMVDLPDYSVLIAGLDAWTAGGEPISEPRLSRKLAAVLGVPSVDLRTPPPADDDPTAPPRGIVAFQFPEWFIVQGSRTARRWKVSHSLAGAQEVAHQRQVHRSRPEESAPLCLFGSFAPVVRATSEILIGMPSRTMDRPTAPNKSASYSSTSGVPAET